MSDEPLFYSDGVHMTNEGHKFMADVVKKILEGKDYAALDINRAGGDTAETILLRAEIARLEKRARAANVRADNAQAIARINRVRAEHAEAEVRRLRGIATAE
jgi:hypothetical protein